MNPKAVARQVPIEGSGFLVFTISCLENSKHKWNQLFWRQKNMTLKSQPSRANAVLAPKATPHKMGLSLNWWVVCTRSLTVLPVSRALPKPAFLATDFGRFPDSFVSDRNKPVYSFSDKAFQGLLAGFTSVAQG